MENLEKVWRDYFADVGIPQDLLKLLNFAETTSKQQYFSDGFELETDVTKYGLKTWSDNSEFLNALYEFALANGSGATYAFWHYDKLRPLDEMPIVGFGDDGGYQVVTQNFRELLQVLTYDADVYIGFDDIDFFKDEDPSNSPYHDEFVTWLSENFGLKAISKNQLNQIVADANAKYGKKFIDWVNYYYQLSNQ